MHSVTAKEFMIRDVVSVTETTTYRDVEDMLDRFPYMTFPIIKSKGYDSIAFTYTHA